MNTFMCLHHDSMISLKPSLWSRLEDNKEEAGVILLEETWELVFPCYDQCVWASPSIVCLCYYLHVLCMKAVTHTGYGR